MTTYTLEDGSTQEFDYLQICITTEYLPGEQLNNIAISVEFIDEDVAKHALAHIREQHPDAYLSGFASFDETYRHPEHLERIKKRDADYRVKYLYNMTDIKEIKPLTGVKH